MAVAVPRWCLIVMLHGSVGAAGDLGCFPEPGIDFAGHDILPDSEHFFVHSTAECCQSCRDQKGPPYCLYWGVALEDRRNSTGAGRCYLKTSDAGRHHREGMTSGSLTAPAPSPPPTPPPPPTRVEVEVFFNDTPKAFPHFWEECVGSGHAALGLRDDWRAHLLMVHQSCGFKRIRQHGILDDDMGFVLGTAGNITYNFSRIDSVYDYLRSIDMRPVVELSWMPAAIASEPHEHVWCYHGGRSPPASVEMWYQMISEMARHFVERHGVDELRQWAWELWNEPNCSPCVIDDSSPPFSPDGIFPSCVPGKSVRNPKYPGCGTGQWNLEQYLTLFNATSTALKSIDKKLQVGGPSTEQLGWIRELREFAAANNVGIDFLSTHQYPNDPQVPTGVNGHSDQIATAVAEAHTLPLFITEYSVGSHDDPSAAAGILTYIPRLQQGPKMYSYWAFSDVFEEHCLDSTPYHGGWGLVNWYGIPKPSFRAFEMLHNAGNSSYLVKGQSAGSVASYMYSVSTGPDSAITVYALGTGESNRQLFVAAYKSDITDGPEQPNVTISAKLCGMRNSSTTATVRRIDFAHANPKAVWESMGSPQNLTEAQVEALQAASIAPSERVPITTTSSGCLTVELTIPMYSGVAVIEL